jgi:hypothetical protein
MLSAQQELAQLNNMAVTEKTEITLTVTIEEANHILSGLQELAAKICNPLSVKLQKQAQAQLPKEALEAAE